eukprot:1148466-Pelagomonas_calceolata.AAC.4
MHAALAGAAGAAGVVAGAVASNPLHVAPAAGAAGAIAGVAAPHSLHTALAPAAAVGAAAPVGVDGAQVGSKRQTPQRRSCSQRHIAVRQHPVCDPQAVDA